MVRSPAHLDEVNEVTASPHHAEASEPVIGGGPAGRIGAADPSPGEGARISVRGERWNVSRETVITLTGRCGGGSILEVPDPSGGAEGHDGRRPHPAPVSLWPALPLGSASAWGFRAVAMSAPIGRHLAGSRSSPARRLVCHDEARCRAWKGTPSWPLLGSRSSAGILYHRRTSTALDTLQGGVGGQDPRALEGRHTADWPPNDDLGRWALGRGSYQCPTWACLCTADVSRETRDRLMVRTGLFHMNAVGSRF